MPVSNLNSAFTLAFVISSMFGLGLGLTLSELLTPLIYLRLVGAAIAINFVLIPGLSWLLITRLPLDPSSEIGLVIISAVLGSPLGIKAAQIALAAVTSAGSLVVMQILGSVLFLPIALPLFIPSIELNTWAVANSLFFQVLLPVTLGLLVNFRLSVAARMAPPTMAQISNIQFSRVACRELNSHSQDSRALRLWRYSRRLSCSYCGTGRWSFWPDIDRKLRRTLGLFRHNVTLPLLSSWHREAFSTNPTCSW